MSAIQLSTLSTPAFAPPSQRSALTDEKLSQLMQTIIKKKEQNIQSALNGRVNASEAILIGGDLFTMGYMAFEGAQIVKPSLSALPAFSLGTLTCGILAGVINLGVCIVCLKEAIQAFKNGDNLLGARLFIDFVNLASIGAIMILASLATQVSVLGGIGAFFAANPWLLPVLFFIISLPNMVEVIRRLKNIHTGKDLAAQLNTADLQKLIRGFHEKNPFHLQPLLAMDEKSALNALSDKLEQFQADMGAVAALETFKVMQKLLKKEDFEEQLALARKKIAEWNRAQYVRLFQQALYTTSFVVSMAALTPRLSTPAFRGTISFAMTGANAIPLYMDVFWPFKRNTLIVVPKIQT